MRHWIAVILLVAVSGCTRSSFKEKETCYHVGWEFLLRKSHEMQSPVTSFERTPRLGFNRSADTCVCQYEMDIREVEEGVVVTRVREVVDIFTNRVIARSIAGRDGKPQDLVADARYQQAVKALLDGTTMPSGYVADLRADSVPAR